MSRTGKLRAAMLAVAGVAMIPVGLALSTGPAEATAPTSPPAYVAAVGQVDVIDTATNAIVAKVPGIRAPGEVLVAPDGRTVYVSNHLGGTVGVLDTATDSYTGFIT